jgi:hypothetical protein
MIGSAHGEAVPLLGRLEEQSLMTSLLDDVATRGQALVLRGEPGIGKSRLLSVCERTARERGMAVLSTTGVQSEARLRRRISAHERSDRAKARSRQLREQVPPGVRRVRESVQAQRQRPAAQLENPELDPIRRDAPAARLSGVHLGPNASR